MGTIDTLETKITFHNKMKIKVQAQIFVGYTLISTCVTAPGESGVLMASSTPYDIYFKNGATGWEIARKLGNDIKNFTLSLDKGRYVVT